MNKKTIILVIVLILAIGAGVLWYADNYIKWPVVENSQQNKQRGQEEKHPLEGVFENPEKFETEIVFKEDVDVSDWIFYENDVYSLYYPKDLMLIKNPLDGEADNWFKYEMKDEYPIISVNYENYSDFRFNYKKQLIKDNKKITIVEMDNIKGWYTDGASNEKIIKGATVPGKIFGSGFLFVVNNKIIGIGLVYEYDNKNIVKTFNQIMSTIKFK